VPKFRRRATYWAAAVLAAALVGATPAGAAIHFSKPKSFAAGSDPVAIATGDFDRNGRLDLAVADFNGSNLSVLPGMGDGSFAAPQTLVAAAPNPESLAVGRLNTGSDLDIASGTNGKVSVFLGGAGTGFGPVVPIGSYGTKQARGTVIDDFNGDHKRDIAVTEDEGNLLVFLGNGDGTFQPQLAFALPTSFAGPIVSGRVNGDKRPDIVAAGNGRRSVWVFRSRQGDDLFRPAKRYRGPSGGVAGVALGRLNGDKRADIVAVGGGAEAKHGGGVSKPALAVLLGRKGGFRKTKLTPLSGDASPQNVAIADFDHDGTPDLAVAISNGNVDLFRGLGNGRFAKPKVLHTGLDLRYVVAAKLNADKRPDLALAAGGGDSVAVMLGKP
jgi:FG-GAP-like repeat